MHRKTIRAVGVFCIVVVLFSGCGHRTQVTGESAETPSASEQAQEKGYTIEELQRAYIRMFETQSAAAVLPYMLPEYDEAVDFMLNDWIPEMRERFPDCQARAASNVLVNDAEKIKKFNEELRSVGIGYQVENLRMLIFDLVTPSGEFADDEGGVAEIAEVDGRWYFVAFDA